MVCLLVLFFETQFVFLLPSFFVLDYHHHHQIRVDPSLFPFINLRFVPFGSSHLLPSSSVRSAIYSCCLYFLFLTSLYEVPTSSRDEDGLPPKESRLEGHNKISVRNLSADICSCSSMFSYELIS